MAVASLGFAMTRFRDLSVASTVCVVALLAAATPATALDLAGRDDAVSVSSASDLNTEWTDRQMAEAVSGRQPDNSEGEMMSSVDDGAPATDASSDDAVVWAPQSSGDRRTIPLKYSGKLFFKEPSGKGSYCSAQFISSRIILTAAHCVRSNETGAWYGNFRFALQYERGNYVKQYSIACTVTKSGWVNGKASGYANRRYDYALLVTNEDSISGYFGSASSWRGNYRDAVKLGYPSEIEGGKVIQLESGPLYFPPDRPGTVAIRHSNPRSGGGSSGGAFVANFSYAGGPRTNLVVSVTASTYGKNPNVDLGPYLDGAFHQSFQRLKQVGCR
jgi:V8-like Glu-specific endopeptidase